MSLKVSLVLGYCFLAIALSERVRFTNYHVYKVNASSATELALLRDLEGSSDSITFFDSIYTINRDIQVLVAPHKIPDFLQLLGSNEIEYKLIEPNFQRVLDEEQREDIARADDDDEYNWTKYHELDDTYIWLRNLPKAYPKAVTLIEGGKSYERRSILGVKISYPGKTSKPGIFLEAGIHAREWIAPATATYIINQLLTSEDASIRNIAESYDWYIFPHTNPDGYVYTHTTNRSWRKTRSLHGTCYGADPNRNWDLHWNEVGTSDKPCSDTYAGTKAFSEIETRTLAKFIDSLKGKIHLYISFHSYSQYLLYPYGYSNDLPDNVNHYKQVFDVAVAAIAKRYGTKYTGGNIYDAIYPAAGSSTDWIYGNDHTKMSFCFELRPGPNSILTGFRLPAAQIIPTGEETLDGIVAMISEIDKLGYFKV